MPVLCLCYRKCPYVSQACTEMFMDEMVMKSESCKVTQGKCGGYRWKKISHILVTTETEEWAHGDLGYYSILIYF